MKPELAVTVIKQPAENPENNVHTALGMSDERAQELGNAVINLMVEERDIIKTLQFIGENVENANELAFFAFSAGQFIGQNTNPLAKLAAMMAGGVNEQDAQ